MAHSGYKNKIFTSKEQQIEGLKFVAKHVTVKAFERTLDILVWNRFFTKSRAHSRRDLFRKALNLSYDEYRKRK